MKTFLFFIVIGMFSTAFADNCEKYRRRAIDNLISKNLGMYGHYIGKHTQCLKQEK